MVRGNAPDHRLMALPQGVRPQGQLVCEKEALDPTKQGCGRLQTSQARQTVDTTLEIPHEGAVHLLGGTGRGCPPAHTQADTKTEHVPKIPGRNPPIRPI